MEWAGSIRVDNISYSWLGVNAPRTNPNLTLPVTNVQITPTRSIYVMTAGPMNITVTFLSPIEVSHILPWQFVVHDFSSLRDTVAIRSGQAVYAVFIRLC